MMLIIKNNNNDRGRSPIHFSFVVMMIHAGDNNNERAGNRLFIGFLSPLLKVRKGGRKDEVTLLCCHQSSHHHLFFFFFHTVTLFTFSFSSFVIPILFLQIEVVNSPHNNNSNHLGVYLLHYQDYQNDKLTSFNHKTSRHIHYYPTEI